MPANPISTLRLPAPRSILPNGSFSGLSRCLTRTGVSFNPRLNFVPFETYPTMVMLYLIRQSFAAGFNNFLPFFIEANV